MNIAQKSTFERLIPEATKELANVTLLGAQVQSLGKEELLVAVMILRRELQSYNPAIPVTKTIV